QRIVTHPPNAVRQRVAAIAQSRGDYLLLLDDDVVLERDCVEQLLAYLQTDPEPVAVMANLNNSPWPGPTRAWRLYLRHVLRLQERAWQGQVVGPLLRFGYSEPVNGPSPMQWLGTCQAMVRRSAYDRAGGFSDFFLHRSTINEDVDLGIKLARLGPIMLCPAARLAHNQAAGGRVTTVAAAEDDLYNRFMIMHRTQGRSALAALGQVAVFAAVETSSNVIGALLRRETGGVSARLWGRVRALARAVASALAA
ncbi:MAG TPA: glycosyltransferase, partial [Vicinamibacterales bacterium]|nr:glycosyltransferase [Vicinamibacterales bacterium]